MNKTINNPLDEELSIQYKGTVYTIKAKGSLELPSDAAMYWVNHIHKFLTVSEEIKEVVKEVEKVVEEVVEKVSKPKKKI